MFKIISFFLNIIWCDLIGFSNISWHRLSVAFLIRCINIFSGISCCNNHHIFLQVKHRSVILFCVRTPYVKSASKHSQIFVTPLATGLMAILCIHFTILQLVLYLPCTVGILGFVAVVMLHFNLGRMHTVSNFTIHGSKLRPIWSPNATKTFYLATNNSGLVATWWLYFSEKLTIILWKLVLPL